MNQVRLQDTRPPLRADGQLANLVDWSPAIARHLAEQDGLLLGPAHWEVIDLLRAYYRQFNISPIRKLLYREIREQLGLAKADPAYLLQLFPADVLVQGVRIAGVPMPLLDADVDRTQVRRPYPGTSAITTQTPNNHQIVFRGRRIPVYPMGNLVNLDDWDQDLAEHLAQREGIQLGREHWEVLAFLRDFYYQFGITPMVKLMIKHMRIQHGDIKSSRAYLYNLFPGGPARQGSRIAGLPEPQGCIDP